ncbi:MAG TPA: ABC transporter substrate-binding protein [Acidimicrobiales bacterium]|nr:ABC transporter substrate-binding protein [Acidimicrobiales bacterium]
MTPIPNGVIQLGADTGYYRRNGLNVKLVTLEGTTEAAQALASGEVDVANLDTSEALELVAQHLLTLKAVDSTGSAPDYVLVARDSIKNLSDLAGATYAGLGAGSEPNFLFGYLLARNHISSSRVHIDNVGSPLARILAVVNGQADATMVSDAQWSSLTAQQKAGLHLLLNQLQFLKAVPFQAKVNVAAASIVKKDAPAIQLFVTLTMKLSRYYYTHPNDWAAAVARQRSDLVYAALANLAHQQGFKQQWCVNGCLNRTVIARTAALLFRSGALPPGTSPVGINSWIDETFVQRALHQLGVMKGVDKP